ncbi:MAG: hypothetical protein ACK4NF_02765 [Planctomycetota bacterium]
MKAVLINEKTIACPVCLSTKFYLLSRHEKEDGIIEYRCECENCSINFSFFVDKRGEYILDTGL